MARAVVAVGSGAQWPWHPAQEPPPQEAQPPPVPLTGAEEPSEPLEKLAKRDGARFAPSA